MLARLKEESDRLSPARDNAGNFIRLAVVSRKLYILIGLLESITSVTEGTNVLKL